MMEERDMLEGQWVMCMMTKMMVLPVYPMLFCTFYLFFENENVRNEKCDEVFLGM